MSDVQNLMDRQAAWQQTRRRLSWPEKIRMAERAREDVRKLREGRLKNTAEPGNAEGSGEELP